ncbi:MAG: fumarylacetoacetase, partial [Butyricicoccus sp.]|nr:fumarylacetoacetase [Butyricicoccus sp.]
MRLYTYRLTADAPDRLGVGYAENTNVLFPLEAFGLSFADMNSLIREITSEQMQTLANPPADVEPLALADLVARAPIPYPLQDVLCLGINYRAHHEEIIR